VISGILGTLVARRFLQIKLSLLIIFWITAYGFYKLVIYPFALLLDNGQALEIVIESGLLVIGVVLAYNISRQMSEFYHLLEDFILPEAESRCYIFLNYGHRGIRGC
jgi:hypothetical protein